MEPFEAPPPPRAEEEAIRDNGDAEEAAERLERRIQRIIHSPLLRLANRVVQLARHQGFGIFGVL